MLKILHYREAAQQYGHGQGYKEVHLSLSSWPQPISLGLERVLNELLPLLLPDP
ncbi:Uncharacterised protein [Acinetobacter baumannii]|nr:Uncharacterised protein [Acinetobacter baumannii]SMB77080.1 Uncharacterised protein [Acinetobacter baumannii]